MKVLGFMSVKDESVMLPEVLRNVRPLVDDILVFDDFSIDGTWDLIKNETYSFCPTAPRLPSEGRSNYQHLLDVARRNYNYNNEEVWGCITEGDKILLGGSIRQSIEKGIEKGFTAIEHIQIDFRRHPDNFWTEENDSFPNYSPGLREQCRWACLDEGNTHAFKITDKLTYDGFKYPWPGGKGKTQFEGYFEKHTISPEQLFWEHHRGSPNMLKWRIENGSRRVSSKHKFNLSSYESLLKDYRLLYGSPDVLLWEGEKTLNSLLSRWNSLPVA